MLPVSVALPPASRPTAGLLAAGRSFDDVEWWRGVVVPSTGCVEPILHGPCTDQTDSASSLGANSMFAPTTARQGLQCSALSQTDIEQLAQNRLEPTLEYAAARVLLTGAGTEHLDDGETVTNPSLHSSATTVLDVAGDPIDALACIEQRAGENLYGAEAFIHVPPAVAAHLIASNGVWRDTRAWRTAAGNRLIVSPGYLGEAPDGTLADNEQWIYASTEVFVATGQRATIVDQDRDDNTETAWADELVLVAFDPCWVGAARVAVNVC